MCEANSVCGVASVQDPLLDILNEAKSVVLEAEVNRLQSVCIKLDRMHYMPEGTIWEAIEEINQSRPIGLTLEGFVVSQAYKGGRLTDKFSLPDILLCCLRRLNLYRSSLGYIEADKIAFNKCFWLSVFGVVSLRLRLATGDELGEVFEKYRIGSCMRDWIIEHGSRDIVDVYTENPDKVGVAYMLQEDSGLLCSAFSILYYTQGEEVIVEVKNYSRGYLMPFDQFKVLRHKLLTKTFGDYVSVEDVDSDYTLSLRQPSSGIMPYIDTFDSFETSGSYVLLSKYGRSHSASDTQGTRLDGSRNVKCYQCGCYVGEDSLEIGGDEYCSDCCITCPVTDEVVSTEDCSYIELYTRSYYGGGSSDHVLVSDYAIRYSLVETEDGPYIDSCDAITSEEGLYYLPDSDLYSVTDNGEVYAADDVVETIDGEMLHVDDCEEVSGYRRRS